MLGSKNRPRSRRCEETMKPLSKESRDPNAALGTTTDGVIDVVDDFVLIPPLPLCESDLPSCPKKVRLPPVVRPAVPPPPPRRASLSLRSVESNDGAADPELPHTPKLPPVRPPPARTAPP